MGVTNLKAYTDGACGNNGDWAGGYGYVFYLKDEMCKYKWLYLNGGGEANTTNNIMEMKAFLGALEYFERWCKVNSHRENTLTIYTDSAYIYNCLTQKWYLKWLENGWVNSKGEPVKNKELWQRILSYIIKSDNIIVEKVKGHSDNEFNNFVDTIAVDFKEKVRHSIDKGE